MPQSSVAYAVARVHIRMREALDGSHLDRLLSESSYEDALRTLAEIGWVEASENMDIEAIATSYVQRACALVKAISPCQNATDSFLLRYDGLNLKALLKARCLGRHAANLSTCGVIPQDKLIHAVTERSYATLPKALNTALTSLEKILAVREDALAIDTTVDKAIYTLIHENMRNVQSHAVQRYFVGRVDMLSAIMLLRIKHVGKNTAFLQDMLLPGGSIPQSEWMTAFERTESIPRLIAKYGSRVCTAASMAIEDASTLPMLEKAMDDALLQPFTKLRHEASRIEPVVGYLLGAEREAAAVRLILAGIKNGFSKEAIRERLRDLYYGK